MPSFSSILPTADLDVLRCPRSQSGFRSVYIDGYDTDGNPRYYAKVRHNKKLIFLPDSCCKQAHISARAVVLWYKQMFGENWQQAARTRKSRPHVAWRISHIKLYGGWIITVWVKGFAQVVPELRNGKVIASQPLLFDDQWAAERYVRGDLIERYGPIQKEPKPAPSDIKNTGPVTIFQPAQAKKAKGKSQRGKFVMQVVKERKGARPNLFAEVKSHLGALEAELKASRERAAQIEKEMKDWQGLASPGTAPVATPSNNGTHTVIAPLPRINTPTPVVVAPAKPKVAPKKAATTPKLREGSHAYTIAGLIAKHGPIDLDALLVHMADAVAGLANPRMSLYTVVHGKKDVFRKGADNRYSLLIPFTATETPSLPTPEPTSSELGG